MAYFCFVFVNSMSLVLALALALALKLWSLALALSDSFFQVLGLGLVSQVLVNITGYSQARSID